MVILVNLLTIPDFPQCLAKNNWCIIKIKGIVMKMAKASKPKPIQLFENWLWTHSPNHWVIKSVYYQETLFVSILIETSIEEHQTIRRSFSLDIINSRSTDLCGLASDIIDEVKTEINN